MKHWTLQLLLALDQLLNVLLGVFLVFQNKTPDVWADETYSARCWRKRDSYPYKITRKLVDLLFFFQSNHCEKSFESETKRLQSPLIYRYKKLVQSMEEEKKGE